MQANLSSPLIEPSDSYARIRDPRRMRIIRILTIAIFFLLFVQIVVEFVPGYMVIDDYLTRMLAPATVDLLASIGLSPQILSVYSYAGTLIVTVISIAVALWIFAQRSDDWFAIVVSIFVFTLVSSQISRVDSVVEVLVVNISSYLIFPIMCMLPNGRFLPRWAAWLVPPYMVIYVIQNILAVAGRLEIAEPLYLVVSLFWLLGLIFMLNRLRRIPNGIQRQQLKLVFMGLLAAVIGAVAAGF